MGKDATRRLFVEPQCFEEFLGSSFWWNEHAVIIGAGFSRARAGELHARGLQRIRDAWNFEQVRFLTGPEVADRFDLSPAEFETWDAALTVFRNQWGGFQSSHAEFLREFEFAGLFLDEDDTLHVCIVPFQEGLQIPLRDQGLVKTWIPLSCPIYTVKTRTRYLSLTDAQKRAEVAVEAPDGSGLASLIVGKIRKV